MVCPLLFCSLTYTALTNKDKSRAAATYPIVTRQFHSDGKMNNYTNSIEEFNSLIVEYLNYFNLIEINVGLCIAHLETLDRDAIYKKLARLSFEKKIECLYSLTSNNVVIADKNGLKEIEDWCSKAQTERHQRNRYMHGHWCYLPHLEEGVELNIPPWFREKYSESHEKRMSMDKLRKIVEGIRSCFNELNVIRDKFRI